MISCATIWALNQVRYVGMGTTSYWDTTKAYGSIRLDNEKVYNYRDTLKYRGTVVITATVLGLGLLLLPQTVHEGPFFVAAKNATSNTLYVTNQLEVLHVLHAFQLLNF